MIRERVNAGLTRAKAEGKRLGRPRNDDAKRRATVARLRKQGVGILKIASEVSAGNSYVQRIVAERLRLAFSQEIREPHAHRRAQFSFVQG